MPLAARRSPVPLVSPWTRRLVLGVALALGIAAGAPRTSESAGAAPVIIVQAGMVPKAHAATPESAGAAAGATAPGTPAVPAAPTPPAVPKLPKAPAAAEAPASPPAPSAPAAGTASPAPGDADADVDADSNSDADAGNRSAPRARAKVTIDTHGVTVEKNGRVRVQGLGNDQEFDSFNEFVDKAPWLAGLVFLSVVLVFLVPLLIVVLLIWYKIRKTRMQNETMLRLAERGVVPPAEAMQSLASRAPADVPPSAAPLYEQARQLRRHAAWSDLRKAVVLCAVGLAFLFYSMINEASASWVGLICLFLGIGYGALYWLEDRGAPVRRDAGPPPAGSA